MEAGHWGASLSDVHGYMHMQDKEPLHAHGCHQNVTEQWTYIVVPQATQIMTNRKSLQKYGDVGIAKQQKVKDKVAVQWRI